MTNSSDGSPDPHLRFSERGSSSFNDYVTAAGRARGRGSQGPDGGRGQPREHAGRPLPGINWNDRGGRREYPARTPPRRAGGGGTGGARSRDRTPLERPDRAAWRSWFWPTWQRPPPGPTPSRRRAGRRGSGSGSWYTRPAGTICVNGPLEHPRGDPTDGPEPSHSAPTYREFRDSEENASINSPAETTTIAPKASEAASTRAVSRITRGRG